MRGILIVGPPHSAFVLRSSTSFARRSTSLRLRRAVGRARVGRAAARRRAGEHHRVAVAQRRRRSSPLASLAQARHDLDLVLVLQPGLEPPERRLLTDATKTPRLPSTCTSARCVERRARSAAGRPSGARGRTSRLEAEARVRDLDLHLAVRVAGRRPAPRARRAAELLARNASTSTQPDAPCRTRVRSFSTRFATSRTTVNRRPRRPGRSGDRNARIEVALADEAVHRRSNHGIRERDLQLVEPRLACANCAPARSSCATAAWYRASASSSVCLGSN